MVRDAGFEDGGERAARLRAESEDDLAVISTLAQDAVGKVVNVRYAPRRRRFSLLLYRFRWEDEARAKREKRPFERVASSLIVEDVLKAKVAGLDPKDGEAVFNVLSLTFEAGEDGAGLLLLTCSGDATIRLDVECLNVSLADLTRPWETGGQPKHAD